MLLNDFAVWGPQVSGIWRVTRDAVNERERRERVWLAVSRSFGDIGLKEPSPLVSAEPEVRTRKHSVLFTVSRSGLLAQLFCV